MNNRNQIGGTFRHMYRWAVSDLLSQEISRPPHPEQHAPVIYYIHGTGDRTGGFSEEAESLLRRLPDSFSKIHLVSFDDRASGQDIESFAWQLAHKIRADDNRDVILIGHSRGGLVAAWFAENLAQEIGITVHSIAAISSPFGGSDFARAPLTWCSASVNQMQRESPFLETLREKISHSSTPYVYFHGSNDILVSIDSACIESHREYLTSINGHNHLSVVHSPELLEHLHHHLTHFSDRPLQRVTDVRNNREIFTALQNAVLEMKADHLLYKAGNDVLQHAEFTIPKDDDRPETKNWRLSVKLATQVIQNPSDTTAVHMLALNARLYAPGKCSRRKQFVCALAVLAGIALVSLGVVGIPLLGLGITAQLIGGSLLCAGGTALFYHNRQKTLSKAAMKLAKEAEMTEATPTLTIS